MCVQIEEKMFCFTLSFGSSFSFHVVAFSVFGRSTVCTVIVVLDGYLATSLKCDTTRDNKMLSESFFHLKSIIMPIVKHKMALAPSLATLVLCVQCDNIKGGMRLVHAV
jgi:hypothetical protein